jgi:hypothetical protein
VELWVSSSQISRSTWSSSTLCGSPPKRSALARATLWAFNRQGAFDNLAATKEGLLEILEESF